MKSKLLLIALVSLLQLACQSGKNNPTRSDDSLSGQSSAANEPVLYLRGGFNGWGSDNPFTPVHGNRFESEIRIAPGNHEFKIASIDWRQEWIIEGADRTPAELDKEYLLKPGGAGSFLFARTTGVYLFSFDKTDPVAPVLSIRRSAENAEKKHDPHQGKRKELTVEFETWDDKKEQARFSIPLPEENYRHYTHSSTQPLRDPVPSYTHYSEVTGYPRLRSGNLQFDALYALALDEMRLNSVSHILDGNYKQGEAIACECFETGEKWHYVWTRDLAYAADLGLAMYDPARVRNALAFKLSSFRNVSELHRVLKPFSEGEQIVQDTGTGGSWPVSTDRVAWAFGADKALTFLNADERKTFAPRAFEALKNTLEIDRLAAFDVSDGLYRGEQSFLDWREQSYAAWVTDDIARLASAKALSTNVAHYQALSLAAKLARELGFEKEYEKYSAWAQKLKASINAKFWLEAEGQYSSLTASHFDDSPLKKYDLLGLALAIKTGVAEGARAQRALAAYPHGPMGAPVIFPQQPDIPVYHNRAIWPFVTGYALHAAIKIKNINVANEAYNTLIRAASLNLSNMENLEWLSAQPMLLDEETPRLSGPVINSKRQLWSVGAYLSMVSEGVFGISLDGDNLSLAPFITTQLQRKLFSQSKRLSLFDFTLKDKRLDLHIELPNLSDVDGYYPIKNVSVNGVTVDGPIALGSLNKTNVITVQLANVKNNQQGIYRVSGNPYSNSDPALFSPASPSIISKAQSGTMPLPISIIAAANTPDTHDQPALQLKLLSGREAPAQTADAEVLEYMVDQATAACYVASATFLVSGNTSHHSRPLCLGSQKDYKISDMDVEPEIDANLRPSSPSGSLLTNWGKPGERLRLSLNVDLAGRHAVQVRYRNLNNQINLGITNGVKWISIYDSAQKLIASGVVQMPHTKAAENSAPHLSTPLFAYLEAGVYSMVMQDFFNMSYLTANTDFTGTGGSTGLNNRFDLAGIRLLRLD